MDLSADHETVKIKLSSKLDKKAPVFIADFSCGRLNENSKMVFECFKSQNNSDIENRAANRILNAQSKHLTYSGGAGENTRKAPVRYLVGVHNKGTGKMKLYDSVIFHLKPVLPTAVNITDTNVTPLERNYWEDKNKLTAAFGGKVSKRVLNAQLKFAISRDSLEDAVQEDSPMSSPMPSMLSSESPQTLSYLPPVNREATSLDEVFDINDIISPEEDSALDDHINVWLQTFRENPEAAKANFCKFTLLHIEEAVEDPTKLKLLLYYNYMTILNQLNYADIRKKDPTTLIPEPFKQNLLKKFTSFSKSDSGRQTRVFPPQQRDKLVAYIVVLALYINNYCININQVMADLKKVNSKQFNLITQNIGCYITTRKIDDQSVKFAELKLPLNVPSTYSRKKF